MRIRTHRLLLAAALTLLFAAAARAEPIDLSYTWQGPSFEVRANGGTRDGAAILVVPHQLTQNPANSPVTVWAFTSPRGGNDTYNDAAYSLTFDVHDSNSGQSHSLRVAGQFDGTVTSDRVNLSNAFTGGSGVQTFDFLGHDVTVKFGFAAVASNQPWEGDITASVSVGAVPTAQHSTPAPSPASLPGPASAPEPTTLVLAALALPALCLAGRRVRGRHTTAGSAPAPARQR